MRCCFDTASRNKSQQRRQDKPERRAQGSASQSNTCAARGAYKSKGPFQLERTIKLECERVSTEVRRFFERVFLMKMLPALPSARKHTAPHHAHLDSSNTPRAASNGGSSLGKRPASMIFRIEHLLPSATPPDISVQATASASRAQRAESSAHKRSKQSQQRSGVYVSQFTPKDTLSEALPTHALLAVPAAAQEQQITRAYCCLNSSQQALLSMTPSTLRKIKLSEDIPSYNALFELQGGCVRLRTVRDIARDDEIVAWFGEEATLLMSIPFLTPLNIQGNNRYTCHLCHLTFETPNPLKIHLALGCGRHSIDILWIRLHYALQATSACAAQLPPAVSFSVSSVPAQLSPAPAPSTSSSISPAASPPPPTAQPPRFSAFKPISTSSITSVHSSMHSAVPVSIALPPSAYGFATMPHTTTSVSSHSALSFLPSMPTVSLPTMSLLHTPASSSNPLNAAAQIEAIVSNMGASKQGHLCIYCGKVYSRKYGLKIHIRTHTGFKPLKCKFCLRPFGDPSNLNKHVRLHLQTSASASAVGVEGYNCHLCHKTLARRRDLQRHMESRHATSIPQSHDAPPEKAP